MTWLENHNYHKKLPRITLNRIQQLSPSRRHANTPADTTKVGQAEGLFRSKRQRETTMLTHNVLEKNDWRAEVDQ